MSDGAKSEQTHLVTRVDQADLHEQQLAAERQFLHAVLVGMGVGMVVCAGVWIGIVVLAMMISDNDIGPMIGVGAGCGLFAGIFLGGAAGASAGVGALERAEHASLPKI
jgi:hypothetical protein